MPAVVAVPLISAAISGATQVAAAKIQSNAVNKAQQTQAAAGQQAIAAQQRALNPALAMVGPTTPLGPNGQPMSPAAAALANTPGYGNTPAAPGGGPFGAPSGQFGTLGDIYGKIASAQLANLSPYTSLGGGAASALGFGMGNGSVPSAPSLAQGQAFQAPTAPAPQASASGFGLGAPQQSAATVPLRAPDGSIKAIPADQVSHYLAMGAKRLEQTA
jgi:hypothetical protein